MIDYDFSTLNDKEFENLTIELISKEKNKRYERFKVGKDGGIDGRFYHDDGSQEIIQCKHYLKTGLSGLISSLKKKNDKGINEIIKVQKLNPSKYIFITSIALSADNKKTIKELFTPYIKNDNDIYGQEDLNQILGDNPEIEKRYYKLWLSSTVVLDRIFNNAIEGRSEYLLEEIQEKAKFYVITDNHNKSLNKLEKSNIIIIAGEPGIGKTTLANHLALWYIEKGFRFYDIENSINEAESIYKRDEKQIFYFDDFLGSNYLNAIENKKDSHIVKFISRVKRDKNKRFILTSRTNIFNQGLALSDTFKSKNIENDEFIIKIDSLEDIDKGKILYNHIWHSELDEEYINEIYIDKRYKKIINHKNFNPRLIEFITDIDKVKLQDIKVKKYWEYIVEKLDNPQDIWKNTFDEGSDDFIRAIVLLTVFNGNKIEENALRNAYNRYCKLAHLSNNSNSSKDFDSVVIKVVKYFLNRSKKYDDTIEYSLFNPSIADFIFNRYENEITILKNIFVSLESQHSLSQLFSLSNNDIITNSEYLVILDDLLQKSNLEQDTDYLIRLNNLLYVSCELEYNEELLKNLIQSIINNEVRINLVKEFANIVFLFSVDNFNIENLNFFYTLTAYYYRDIEEVNSVIKLYNYFKLSDENMIDDLNKMVTEYIEVKLSDEANTISDYSVGFEEILNEAGYFEVGYQEVERIIDDRYDDLENSIEDFDGFDINETDIKDCIDIEEIKFRISSDYTSKKMDNYINDNESTNILYSDTNTIDDLFER